MLHNTVSLIGMPGAGKSTVGVLLAKELGYNFVDSDIVIQDRHGATLQEIIDQHGHQHLRQLEEDVLLDLPLDHLLLATGGSAVYSEASMARLKKAGPVVFIDVPLEALEQRVDNEDSRGIAKAPGQSFGDVFRERQPLYHHYADIHIEGHRQSPAATVQKLAKLLS